MSNVKVLAQQASPRVVADGSDVPLRATRDGIPFVATWKEALLLEGRCFQFTVGDLADTALTALIQGGGAGTGTNLDEPEIAVSVGNGLALLPLDIIISTSNDIDANDRVAEALIIADKTAACSYPGVGAGTPETAVNMITDGPGSAAMTASALTTVITDPVCSMILAHKLVRITAVTDTTGSVDVYLRLHYEPDTPPILKGPAAFYGYWGATTRSDGCASVVYAEVPEGRFDLS